MPNSHTIECVGILIEKFGDDGITIATVNQAPEV
jgi:hypothetical protein